MKTSFKAAILAFPLFAAHAHAQDETIESFAECAPEKLQTFEGEKACLTKVAIEVDTLTQGVYGAIGEKIVELAPQLKSEDFMSLMKYGTRCEKLLPTAYNPESAFKSKDFRPFELPDYCLSETMNYAVRFDVPLDEEKSREARSVIDALNVRYPEPMGVK